MRGRKPLPSHLHLVRGTGKERARGARGGREPRPAGNLKACPDWFTLEQREAWDYAIAHAPGGLLKKLDRDVLAVWVVAADLWRQAVRAQAQVDAGKTLPLLTKTPNGMAQQSPYVGIISKQSQIMLKAAAELGFTPSARSRIEIDPSEDEDEGLEEILGKGA